MLGKVVVVAGAAYLLRTKAGQRQLARVRDRVRAGQTGGAVSDPAADLRPPAAIEHRPPPPLLLPDATPVEVARAVLADQPRA